MQDNSAHVSAPNADTRAWDEWLDIPPTVCVVHLRFVPCRRDEPESRCHISTDPKQVTIVRDYQTGKLSESFTHAALDRLQQSDGTAYCSPDCLDVNGGPCDTDGSGPCLDNGGRDE